MPGLYPGIVLSWPRRSALAVTRRGSLARARRVPRLGLRAPSPTRDRSHPRRGIFTLPPTPAFDQLVGENWTIRETALMIVGVPATLGAIGSNT